MNLLEGSASSNLNTDYKFDNFTVDNTNEFSYKVAGEFTRTNMGQLLYVYGNNGVGKTHLVQAIGNKFKLDNKTVLYRSMEQYINEFTENLRNQTLNEFKDKFRNCDLLLIDDIDALYGKEATQEQFYNNINALIENNNLVVLVSDKHPTQIHLLYERLSSQLKSALIIDIKTPEQKIKRAIVENKNILEHTDFSEEVLDYISSIIEDNLHEIEGVFLKLSAYTKLMKVEITIDNVKEIINKPV